MAKGSAVRGKAWVGYAVALVTAIAGAIASQVYDDAKAVLFPDRLSGDYVSLTVDDPGKLEQAHLLVRSHDGVIRATGQAGDKKWTYHGYLKNGYVVLAYRSAESTGIGFGTLFLVDPNGNNQVYAGYYEGNVCPERKVHRCNVVLVKDMPDGTQVKAARVNYADYLKQKCQSIEVFDKTTADACPKK